MPARRPRRETPPRSPTRCCARWPPRKSPLSYRPINPSVILRHSYAFTFLFFTFAFLCQPALPEILLLAGLLGDPARQHEEQIAQPIDVFDHLGIDLFRARQPQD